MPEQPTTTEKFRVTLTIGGPRLIEDVTREELDAYLEQHAAPLFGADAVSDLKHRMFTPLSEW